MDADDSSPRIVVFVDDHDIFSTSSNAVTVRYLHDVTSMQDVIQVALLNISQHFVNASEPFCPQKESFRFADVIDMAPLLQLLNSTAAEFFASPSTSVFAPAIFTLEGLTSALESRVMEEATRMKLVVGSLRIAVICTFDYAVTICTTKFSIYVTRVDNFDSMIDQLNPVFNPLRQATGALNAFNVPVDLNASILLETKDPSFPHLQSRTRSGVVLNLTGLSIFEDDYDNVRLWRGGFIRYEPSSSLYDIKVASDPTGSAVFDPISFVIDGGVIDTTMQAKPHGKWYRVDTKASEVDSWTCSVLSDAVMPLDFPLSNSDLAPVIVVKGADLLANNTEQEAPVDIDIANFINKEGRNYLAIGFEPLQKMLVDLSKVEVPFFLNGTLATTGGFPAMNVTHKVGFAGLLNKTMYSIPGLMDEYFVLQRAYTRSLRSASNGSIIFQGISEFQETMDLIVKSVDPKWQVRSTTCLTDQMLFSLGYDAVPYISKPDPRPVSTDVVCSNLSRSDFKVLSEIGLQNPPTIDRALDYIQRRLHRLASLRNETFTANFAMLGFKRENRTLLFEMNFADWITTVMDQAQATWLNRLVSGHVNHMSESDDVRVMLRIFEEKPNFDFYNVSDSVYLFQTNFNFNVTLKVDLTNFLASSANPPDISVRVGGMRMEVQALFSGLTRNLQSVAPLTNDSALLGYTQYGSVVNGTGAVRVVSACTVCNVSDWSSSLDHSVDVAIQLPVTVTLEGLPLEMLENINEITVILITNKNELNVNSTNVTFVPEVVVPGERAC